MTMGCDLSRLSGLPTAGYPPRCDIEFDTCKAFIPQTYTLLTYTHAHTRKHVLDASLWSVCSKRKSRRTSVANLSQFIGTSGQDVARAA